MTVEALPFQIQVLEGELSNQQLQGGQPNGRIQLVGRAMPFQGIVFEGAQRVKTTFYPGNPVATQQVIGPTEKPTTVSGRWSDRYLGPAQARRYAEMFDDIRRRGAPVEVTWGAGLSDESDGTTQVSGHPVVRRGLITNVKYNYDRPQDIKWEIEFTWRGRDDVAVAPISATGNFNPTAGFVQLVSDLRDTQALHEAFHDLQATSLFGISDAIWDTVGSALADIDSAIDKVAQVNSQVTQLTTAVGWVELPFEAAGRLVGGASLAINSVADLTKAIVSIPLLTLELRDDALSLLRLRDQILTLLGQNDAAQETAARAKDDVLGRIEPDVIAEVRAPAGIDLRDLALQFYGDADQWFAIASFNNLSSTAVPSLPNQASDDPALPIRIPRLTPGADIRQVC